MEGEVLVNPLNLIDYDYAHTLIQCSIIHFYCSSIELQKKRKIRNKKQEKHTFSLMEVKLNLYPLCFHAFIQHI